MVLSLHAVMARTILSLTQLLMEQRPLLAWVKGHYKGQERGI
jgi:hypothetical protein